MELDEISTNVEDTESDYSECNDVAEVEEDSETSDRENEGDQRLLEALQTVVKRRIQQWQWNDNKSIKISTPNGKMKIKSSRSGSMTHMQDTTVGNTPLKEIKLPLPASTLSRLSAGIVHRRVTHTTTTTVVECYQSASIDLCSDGTIDDSDDVCDDDEPIKNALMMSSHNNEIPKKRERTNGVIEKKNTPAKRPSPPQLNDHETNFSPAKSTSKLTSIGKTEMPKNRKRNSCIPQENPGKRPSPPRLNQCNSLVVYSPAKNSKSNSTKRLTLSNNKLLKLATRNNSKNVDLSRIEFGKPITIDANSELLYISPTNSNTDSDDILDSLGSDGSFFIEIKK